MLLRTVLAGLAVASFVPTASGCSTSADASDAGTGGNFVAYQSSFDNFHAWSNATATSTADGGDGLHGVGPLRVYWNHAPPHGSTTFPIGTIIVKETEDTDVTQRTVFAMVKRGPGFNVGGAYEWEWFSLQDQPDGSVLLLWRAVPLASDSYAKQPIGDCNGCHTAAVSNNYVWDTALQLSNF